MELEGFVLVGGESSRFGSDKALARWLGRPLLEYPVRLLRELGLVPRLVGRNPVPYAGLCHAFVLAERPGRGPVEGLRAALRAAATPRGVVLPVDMPALGAAVLRALLAHPADGPVCLAHGGRRYPFPGVYPRSALGVLEALAPGSSMQAALDALGAATLEAGDLPGAGDPGRMLLNVNRPGDLEAGPPEPESD
jgi:molybdopterin-guanine dinucleotide biosynthesis protein A